jgi:alpha-L-fucosidase
MKRICLSQLGAILIAIVANMVLPSSTFAEHDLAPGPFEPTWQSLEANYQCPDWFRDAKFGIWAHWTAQCVPEEGDWYARNMYIQGDRQYDHHLKTYGHPADTGFMEFDNLWKAEKWDPERLMGLYKAAGAKYFVALANHHDNFDCYDSKHHEWNSMRVGPKQDIVGRWAKVARDAGLRFGVSNHSAHAWHWFQTAYGYDGAGPRAGERYDAFKLTKADGKGKWWEGLDPQLLYTGPNMVMPDGITGIEAIKDWHEQHDRQWTEKAPAANPAFTENWFLRCQDLVDKYRPDLLYFDNIGELPLEQAGLDVVAHYYNANRTWHDGREEGVVNVKGVEGPRERGVVVDIERGVANDIRPTPWQTDTCIGAWHYQRGQHYKSVDDVVRMLVDIVSKNGCLLLSVPLRGNGTIDADEEAFLVGMAEWMKINEEGIFGTRPWHVFGEGPTNSRGGMFNESSLEYTPEDMRFTTKEGNLYVYLLAKPTGPITVKSLANGAKHSQAVAAVTLLGSEEKLNWKQTEAGLVIEKPAKMAQQTVAAFKVRFE